MTLIVDIDTRENEEFNLETPDDALDIVAEALLLSGISAYVYTEEVN